MSVSDGCRRRYPVIILFLLLLGVITAPTLWANERHPGQSSWDDSLTKVLAGCILFGSLAAIMALAYRVIPKRLRVIEAVRNSDTHRVRAFIEQGISPNLQDKKHGATALHWAVVGGKPEIVELLLEKGADPNIKNKRGESALHIAAFNGRDDLCSLLLEHGARPVDEDWEGLTPFQIAENLNHLAVMRLLEEHVREQ